MTIPKTILSGHISPETAYVVNDYPYGFRLRCSVRYWLEVAPKKGVRMVSQTSNPKKGGIWNKPKQSIYAKFGACLFLDENDHVQWDGLHEYKTGEQTAAWRDTYGEGVPEAMKETMDKWVAAKLAYDARKLVTVV